MSPCLWEEDVAVPSRCVSLQLKASSEKDAVLEDAHKPQSRRVLTGELSVCLLRHSASLWLGKPALIGAHAST